jgi:hypothetical protein
MAGNYCKTCRHARDLYNDWDHTMECRRFPPKAGGDDHARGGKVSVWPVVGRGDWCGEFAEVDPREAPPTEGEG